jgi:hypothetical protein
VSGSKRQEWRLRHRSWIFHKAGAVAWNLVPRLSPGQALAPDTCMAAVCASLLPSVGERSLCWCNLLVQRRASSSAG